MATPQYNHVHSTWICGVMHRTRAVRCRTGLVAAAATLALALSNSTAMAAPVFAGEDGLPAATAEHDVLSAEVERISGLLTAAEDELERLTVEAEATADASRIAQEAVDAAEAQAASAAAELDAATSSVERAQDEMAALGREAFMGAPAFGDAAVLLNASGPDELLERAATLELLGDDRAQRLDEFRAVQGRQERAVQATRDAVAQRDAAAGAAAEADSAAQRVLAEAQQAYDAVAADKAALEAQLRDAEIELLAAQGVADPAAARDEQQRSQLAVARAGTAGLVAGQVTSCYGARWGTMHYGVDIAAPIGTPIYTPAAGVVIEAGPASGFGLAVYLQHADGTVTVYGHINQYFVTAGQLVEAGQQIAEVGNRGQSTGPHLHFETHTGGLYQNRIDPTPWLAARGISLGGGCG